MRLHQGGLLLLIGGSSVEVGLALAQMFRLDDKTFLGLAQLRNGSLQGGAAFLVLLLLALAQILVVAHLLAEAAGLGQTFLDLDLGGILTLALVTETLLLSAVLLAQTAPDVSQGGQHGLLSFQGGGTRGQFRPTGLQLACCRAVSSSPPFRRVCQSSSWPACSSSSRSAALEGLEAAVHFQGVLLHLLLALLQSGGQPIQAQQVGLVLRLAFAQGLAFAFQLLLAGHEILDPARRLRLQLLLALLQTPLLFLQLPTPVGKFRGQGGQLVAAFLGAQGSRLLQFGIELLFAFLHALRGSADGLLQVGEAVAALAVVVVKLLADLGHLAADAVQLLLLAVELSCARRSRAAERPVRHALLADFLPGRPVQRGRSIICPRAGGTARRCGILVLHLLTAAIPQGAVGLQFLRLLRQLALALFELFAALGEGLFRRGAVVEADVHHRQAGGVGQRNDDLDGTKGQAVAIVERTVAQRFAVEQEAGDGGEFADAGAAGLTGHQGQDRRQAGAGQTQVATGHATEKETAVADVVGGAAGGTARLRGAPRPEARKRACGGRRGNLDHAFHPRREKPFSRGGAGHWPADWNRSAAFLKGQTVAKSAAAARISLSPLPACLAHTFRGPTRWTCADVSEDLQFWPAPCCWRPASAPRTRRRPPRRRLPAPRCSSTARICPAG